MFPEYFTKDGSECSMGTDVRYYICIVTELFCPHNSLYKRVKFLGFGKPDNYTAGVRAEDKKLSTKF